MPIKPHPTQKNKQRRCKCICLLTLAENQLWLVIITCSSTQAITLSKSLLTKGQLNIYPTSTHQLPCSKFKQDLIFIPSFHSNTKNYVGKICKNYEVLIGKKKCKNFVGKICKNSEGLICKNSEPAKKLCTKYVGKFCKNTKDLTGKNNLQKLCG